MDNEAPVILKTRQSDFETMREFCDIVIVNSLLATGFAIAVAIVCTQIRRPAVKHLLWVFVLLRLLMPPVWEIDLSQPRSQATGWLAQRIAIQQTEVRFAWHIRWNLIRHVVERNFILPVKSFISSVGDELESSSAASPGRFNRLPSYETLQGLIRILCWLFCGLWLVGSSWVLTQQLLVLFRFRIGLHRRSYNSRIWQGRAEAVAEKMGLSSCPKIRLVREAISPMLWGLGTRVIILLPDRLFERLDRRGQDALLAHELAHYQRGDHWVRLLESVAMICFWWHPVTWWARHEIEKNEEQCCDAIAVRRTHGDRRSYAEALLATVDFVNQPTLPPIATGVGKSHLLRRRIRDIMSRRTRHASLLPRLRPELLFVAGLVLVPFPVLFGTLNTSISKPTVSLISSAPIQQQTLIRQKVQQAGELTVDERHHAVFVAANGKSVDLGVGHWATSGWSENRDVLAIGATDGSVQVLSSQTGDRIAGFQIGNASISRIDFSPDVELLAVATRMGKISIVEIATRRTIYSTSKRNAHVKDIRFADDQSFRIVWSLDKQAN